jgi:pilus assembly protein CpaE
MTVRYSEEDPAITDEDAFTAEEPQVTITNADSNGSAKGAAVVVVEEDPSLLHRMLTALPKPLNTYSFSNLDQVGSARFPGGTALVLVLGASQTDDVVLDKVGALLRGRPGTGAVLVLTQPSAELLRSTLRSGIDDAIETYDLERQLPQAVTDLIHRLENELAAAAAEAARRAAPVGGKKGWVTTVFSPKGGVGKSVVSVNLATALAKRTGKPSVIFDLDLQFGDVAVMLRVNPRHTVVDAISAGSLLDKSLLQSFLVYNEKSNVWALAAPTAPSEAEQVDPAGMLRVLGLLQEMFENVVIDSPPHLSDVVLQAVAESNTVVFIVALDVPSVKNARLGLQAFDLLQFPTEKVMLVINRADSKVHLSLGDIERALEKKVDLALPSEAVVPRSVNQGVPALLEYPKSRFSAQLVQLADMVLARTAAAAEPTAMTGR